MSSILHSVDNDVLGVICVILDKYELKQMSLVDKRLRDISLPLLFQRVCMHFVYNNVWKLATYAIEGMLASTALDIVTGNTRFLDIRISDDINEDSEDLMPSFLPGRLAEFLSAPFRQLRTLVFTIDERKAQTFGDKFRKAGIELHTVTTLLVGAYCDFMVPLCPNVEHVATYDWHFEMKELWFADLLKAVYDTMPSIETLTLDGSRVIDSLKALIPILSQFKELKTLGLVDASSRDVYVGPNGARRVQEELKAANRRVADMVFGACANLDVVVLGGSVKAVVTRGHGGQIQDIRWCEMQRRPMRSFDVPSFFAPFPS
ncbi:hypothetical protein EV421DRAFT_2035171 [Armillaria borealis]|uniref:F-box domain-containing protein n=1 Tax=Armillaria borealis TaxID=47425 RepID=A0AA39MS26_9AGAR|nr:hypothetical protein EV421DRAFT_2035171 [Armillaria borealis]